MQPPPENRSVLYEVNLEADAAIAGPFDTWLRDHVADVLQFDGFRSAEILEDDTAPPGRVRRIVQYRLADRAALDRYLAEHAPAMQAAGALRFGQRFSLEQRVLPHREEFVRGAFSTENCLNCGEVLRGQHCSHCGQHAQVRVLSLWGLVRDVVGDLLDADSRVWRTLWPLAFRPGLLTQEFLRGRRASYTPPFRMYLVLSLLFFVIASTADPGAGVTLNVGDEGANVQLGGGEAAKPAETTAQPRAEAGARRLAEALVARMPEHERAAARRDLEAGLARADPEELAAASRFIDAPCSEQHLRIDAGPVLERYEPRLREACRRIMADQQSFGRALYENIPKMMFNFLPLIAAALGVLYVGSGRYYVEHLLFVTHFHAFFFLAGIVVLLLGSIAGAFTALSGSLDVALVAVVTLLTFYVPWYLLRAMRRVYAQSWWKTLPKFALLGIAYFVSLLFTGIGLLVYTALSL